jgi:hypothetical protein
MIFADHVADHARAFLVGAGRIELEQPHRPEQPAMHGFQPVADVGQRARGDRRQRVDEVALAQRGIEGRVDDGEVGGIRLHYPALASPLLSSKPRLRAEPN